MTNQKELLWTLLPFHELSTIELYEILQCRSEVFVVEQNCVYQDIDDKDPHCLHLIGREKSDGPIAAYTRIVPPGISFAEPSIGRVLTTAPYRRHSYGKLLMRKSIDMVKQHYPNQMIRIGAQTYLDKFYQSLGFIPVGEPYDEDGIQHIEMLHD
ncbi:GNAT family N-acetyltransferase [Sphingobacterium sp. lm-10]|uniref:GNAT family N-acetyltransferase n=1 Tax=Sphingobacterium sp. lm-10 TaxID=2944904 RepID=UPI0020211B4C|nr:GNAT family N-acetyltransferase [Sphingobacterium sp. lm-10]MCL7987657.1 GNAT family N-acetyltransferase [Sphingobacterium sp. lm-10]